MLKRVTIQDFRALRKVDIELRALTVLIGHNDSGRSSFLDAIFRQVQHAIDREDCWRDGAALPAITLISDDNLGFAGTAEIFKLPSVGVPMRSSGVSDQPNKRAPQLEVNGGNLAAFLDYLLRKDRTRSDQVQASLRRLIPGFEELIITTPSPETRAIYLNIEGGFEIAGERLSTGVRMLCFFVALAHHPNPPDVALIEEPENGVHPKRLKDIVGLLRSMTEGEFAGRKVQVILTTHSPYLLDQISLPKDQVVVFQRNASDGSRTASEADDKRLKAFLDEFMLGEVWFNRGEEGLLASTR